MNMFSNAVKLICEKHFDYKCFGCPLLAICDIPTQEQPGETLEEKNRLVGNSNEQSRRGGAPRLIILFILLLPVMIIWETAKKS